VADQSLSTEKKVTLAFRKIIDRQPEKHEIEILLQGYEEEFERYSAIRGSKEIFAGGAYPQNKTWTL